MNSAANEILHRAEDVIPGACFGYTRLTPDVNFVAHHGAGSRLWTTDGREFVDLTLGSGPLVLGHAHPRVVRAVKEQAARGTHFYSMNEPAIALAEAIIERVPSANAVKFCSDGSEATFFAQRLARAATGRDIIIKFDGAYHGYHDYALPGFPGDGKTFGVVPPGYLGIPKAASDTIRIAPFNDIESTKAVAYDAAGRVAAIIVEPVQRAIEPEHGFLQQLRALCDQIGCLLIFDEVVTGFRLDRGGAESRYGVTPDMSAYAKAVGGGLPLGAFTGPKEILNLVVPPVGGETQDVFMSGTLNGNPLASAAGLATLQELDDVDGPRLLEHYGNRLKREITALADSLSIAVQVIGPGAFIEVIFGHEPVVDRASYLRSNRRAAHVFGEELLRQGLYLVPGTKLYLSTEHSDADFDRIMSAVEHGFQLLQAKRLV